MKIVVVVLLAGLGLLFLAIAAMIAGQVIAASGAGWLEPAGLACWCGSWLISVLPIP